MDSLNSAPIRPDVIRQDKGPRLVAVIWVFASLALLTVSIRTWTRFRILHRSGIEDFMILFAWVLSLIYGALLTASVHLGLGKHAFAIDPSKITYAIKLYTIAVPFGVVVLALPTLAIAIILNGLIAPSKWQTCILYFFPVLQFVMGIAGIVILLTQCTPTSALWSPQPGAKCRDKSISINYLYFMSGSFIQGHPCTHDFEIIADSVYSIKAKAKIGLFLVMSATVLAAICALVRVAYITSLDDFRDYTCKPCRFENPRSKMIDSLADTTINHTMWAVMEGNVIIIAACLPGLRPFVKFGRSRSTKRHRPPPLLLGSTASHINLSNASTALPTPLSARRKEPRSSGSVCGSLSTPSPRVYRHSNLARVESTPGAGDEGEIVWQQGYGKGKEKAETAGKFGDLEDQRGKTRGMEAGEAVEVDSQDIEIDGDLERQREVQELREILQESRPEARRSWLERVRGMADKRMTI
ncbi:MAG: hypothetical protein Q9171_006453 [Xanthocarpia ochracea]